MKIINQISVTPGKLHAWYLTDLGISLRKPIGDHVGKYINAQSRGSRISLWARFVAWLIGLWK